jgi:hypothetical protein
MLTEVSKEGILRFSGLKMEAKQYTGSYRTRNFPLRCSVVLELLRAGSRTKHGKANKLILVSFPFGRSKYEDSEQNKISNRYIWYSIYE